MSAVIETFNTLLAGGYNPLVASGTQGLVDNLRDFVAPIILVVTSIIAVTFLVRRQVMQFVTFLAIAVGVFAIFYAPELIGNLGQSVGENESITWP